MKIQYVAYHTTLTVRFLQLLYNTTLSNSRLPPLLRIHYIGRQLHNLQYITDLCFCFLCCCLLWRDILYSTSGDDTNYLTRSEAILITNTTSTTSLCWMGRLSGITTKKTTKKCSTSSPFPSFPRATGLTWLWRTTRPPCWPKFMWTGYWWNKSLRAEIFHKTGVILLALEDTFTKGLIYLD